MGSIDCASLESLERSFTDLMASLRAGPSVVSMLESVFSTAGSILHNVFAVVVALVFCLYILLDKERVVKGANSALDLFMPASAAASVRRAAHVANQAFSRFITGQCIEAVILGTLCAIGMGMFGMPYALAIGACVGLTALVPVFGAWLGGAIGFLMILTVDPMQAVWFIVFLIVLQQLETHLIYPNVVGASVGLPGIWVFSAVLVGGALFGVLGMFLGVPAVATIRTLAIERATIVRKRRAGEKAEEA
ncbi:MAG: AI-2E family transporter [Slackia sp.]